MQVDGEDLLEPTDDLVASPPMASLASKVNYTVRLVRLSKRPLSASESYRVFIDELPAPSTHQSKVVTLLTRYSIPAFFYPASASEGKLTWSIEQHDGGSYLSATNSGDMHLRISGLKVQDGNKPVVSFGEGLAGYVLGHSTKTWVTPRSGGGLSGPASLSIIAQTNYGPIRASPTLPTSR
jgi:fimbrial chaperone protein